LNSTESKNKAIGFFFLVVFLLSITPKTYFHEALAHHKDGLVCKEQVEQGPCFHRQAYHCHFDDLVVSVPFVASVSCFVLKQPAQFAYSLPFFPVLHLTSSFRSMEGRGPPQVI
jgi:hypothetical protein